MNLGKFNNLAVNYAKYRPSYNLYLTRNIINKFNYKSNILDVGAGTGKFTEILVKLKFFKKIYAYDPSIQMINEGKKFIKTKNIIWKNLSAEKVKMKDNSLDIISSASSFHWFKKTKILKNFSKILKKNGYFLIIYNSRKTNLSKDESKIDLILKKKYKIKKRVSSGKLMTRTYLNSIIKNSNFKIVSKKNTIDKKVIKIKNYVGAWKSVNDIQFQLGKSFKNFIKDIENVLKKKRTINVFYETKVWVLKNVKQ